MKILHVINSLHTGGAEKLLLETLPRYEKSGIELDLLVLNGQETSFYESFSAEFSGTIYTLGFKTVYNPLHIIGVRKYLVKYDIVHVHLFPALYWVAIASLFCLKSPKLVFTEHNITNRRFESKWSKYIDKMIYSNYDTVIGITQDIVQLVADRFDLHKKVVWIANGIDLQKIKETTALSPQELAALCTSTVTDKKILVQVSAFREQKDQLTLIQALNHLSENVILILAGDGVLRESVIRATEKLGLASRVFFIGNYDKVPSLLKSADIVVLSSKYEGMSLSSIEGMASGKPFVASDVPGLTEIVTGAGLLFEVGNHKELATKINLLLTDTDYGASVANRCQARAAQYDISTMIVKHIKLYQEVYAEK
ncbi:MAG: glycosyltransferase involved in cell wall biosynthesis [Bacteroidia bacterium]|jgi:glycosyltransferase involved in cell wall biosynthesis